MEYNSPLQNTEKNSTKCFQIPQGSAQGFDKDFGSLLISSNCIWPALIAPAHLEMLH